MFMAEKEQMMCEKQAQLDPGISLVLPNPCCSMHPQQKQKDKDKQL
jgi:hypothetical protein